jgi:hypothetical protein
MKCMKRFGLSGASTTILHMYFWIGSSYTYKCVLKYAFSLHLKVFFAYSLHYIYIQ